MTKAILDTNVVFSSLLNPEGAPPLVLRLATSRVFRCYVSDEILREYDEVLSRERFALKERQIAKLMTMFRKTATVVLPKKKLSITTDPDDNIFLECALEARADYVVTGNLRHFPARFQDIRILGPQQFLTVLATAPY